MPVRAEGLVADLRDRCARLSGPRSADQWTLDRRANDVHEHVDLDLNLDEHIDVDIHLELNNESQQHDDDHRRHSRERGSRRLRMPRCASCHKAGSHDTSGFASDLRTKSGQLVMNLGSIDPIMSGITLTQKEIDDLAGVPRLALIGSHRRLAGRCPPLSAYAKNVVS